SKQSQRGRGGAFPQRRLLFQIARARDGGDTGYRVHGRRLSGLERFPRAGVTGRLVQSQWRRSRGDLSAPRGARKKNSRRNTGDTPALIRTRWRGHIFPLGGRALSTGLRTRSSSRSVLAMVGLGERGGARAGEG